MPTNVNSMLIVILGWSVAVIHVSNGVYIQWAYPLVRFLKVSLLLSTFFAWISMFTNTRNKVTFFLLVTQGAASGKCPIVSASKRCHIGLAHTCNIDVECPNGSYCCFDGCRRKCLDPNKDSAGAQGTWLAIYIHILTKRLGYLRVKIS